jgi:twitching motility protein PilJ
MIGTATNQRGHQRPIALVMDSILENVTGKSNGRSTLIQRQTLATIQIMALGSVGAVVVVSIVQAFVPNPLLSIGLGLVCLGMSFVFAQNHLRRATASLSNLQAITRQLADQYLPDHQATDSADDVATLASLLLQFIDRIDELQSQPQSDPQMQADFQHILNILSDLEVGNLTVWSDRQNLLADRLNRTIQNLNQALKNLHQRADASYQIALELQEYGEQLQSAEQKQNQALTETQQQLEAIGLITKAGQTQEQMVSQAKQLAEQAVAESQKGIGALNQSINSLQEGTGLIVQRIRSLDEFVSLAKQFVLDQKRLASLTQVLAMNASMVAARALEQREPDQFATVAREFAAIATQVNNLATQTNQGLVVLQQRTGFVEVVVSGLDKDAQDVTGLVSQFTDSVAQSKQNFEYLSQVAAQIAQVEQAVADANQSIDLALIDALQILEALHETTKTLGVCTSATRSRMQALKQELTALIDNLGKFQLGN